MAWGKQKPVNMPLKDAIEMFWMDLFRSLGESTPTILLEDFEVQNGRKRGTCEVRPRSGEPRTVLFAETHVKGIHSAVKGLSPKAKLTFHVSWTTNGHSSTTRTKLFTKTDDFTKWLKAHRENTTRAHINWHCVIESSSSAWPSML
jgi:hypothetical protein